MALKIRPMFDKVLLEVEPESITTGGIIIPVGEPNERQQRAKVIAVGEGRRQNGRRISPQVKPGDRVLCDKWSMAEFKADGQTFFLAVEDGIIGVLDD